MKNPVTIARNGADDIPTMRIYDFALPDDENMYSISSLHAYLKAIYCFILSSPEVLSA